MLCSVVNDKGLKFNVAIVRKGDRYGLNNCLTHTDANDHGPMVEIYDARYTGPEFGPLGQFVTRYFVSTLLEGGPGREARGLDMCGHVDAWKLDPAAFAELCEALRGI